INLTRTFNDEAVGGIRTGEKVLWLRRIVGGEKEAEAFYREAENIVIVKEADMNELAGGSQRQVGIGGRKENLESGREHRGKIKEAIEKKGRRLNKRDAGNESYARIEEPELGADYFVFYETPAPVAEAMPAAENKITLQVSAALEYKNVTVVYPLMAYKPRQLTVYWIVNESRIQMESVGEDVDGDGVEDNLLWIAPHLSNQTFELEINVINVYSYPAQGENWTVFFNTTGTGNLTIEPFNDRLDGPWEEMKADNEATSNEMKFLELYCGEGRITDDILVVTNDSERRYGDISDIESIASRKLLLENYTCDGKTSSIVNKMNVPGYISLNFTFANDYGSVSSYAHDPTPVNCSTLSSAGTYYILNNNVSTTGTCFTIAANNITLNCQGHTITGEGGSSDYGVSAS
ncbi:MAG: hypothetical protein QME12_09490, partial [Nanoarchaeota archaeon]|nr:hypothetical protein [Nanoarchaeota archaeon]